MIKGIHHIGIAVYDLEAALERWKALFGAQASAIEEMSERGVRLSHLKLPEGPAIELISPLNETSTLCKFLQERGEGIQHFTIEVEDIEGLMEELKRAGLQFVSEKPQSGAEGSLIAFVHPRSLNGVLLELREEGRIKDQEQKPKKSRRG